MLLPAYFEAELEQETQTRSPDFAKFLWPISQIKQTNILDGDDEVLGAHVPHQTCIVSSIIEGRGRESDNGLLPSGGPAAGPS